MQQKLLGSSVTQAQDEGRGKGEGSDVDNYLQ